MANERILVVEDEKKIARFLQLELEHAGYSCVIDFTGASVIDHIGQGHFDLILLDVMLPGEDGLSICKRVREISNIPILILSAKDDVDSKAAGLDHGADDYLTKPFSSKELLARIRALLRKRVGGDKLNESSYHVKDLYIFPDRHEVQVGTTIINLTKKEFELLTYLAQHKNTVLKREQILEDVWGYDYVGDTNIVDVYIRYLRSKVDEVVGKKYIHTVRGIGYVARD